MRDPSDPREWLRHARSNLALASKEPTRAEILFEHLCFEAQHRHGRRVSGVRVADPNA